MKITIETPHLKGQETFIESFKKTIENRYSKYRYIHSINASVEPSQNGGYTVGMLLQLIRGNNIYSSSTADTLNRAVRETIQKTDAQVDRFKTKNILHHHE